MRALLLLLMLVAAAKCQSDNRTIVHTMMLCSVNDTLRYDLEYFSFAIDYINNITAQPEFNYTFRIAASFYCADGELQGSALHKFNDGYLKEPNKALLFGPAYSNQAVIVSNLAGAYYHLPQIGTSATTPALADKKLYPYFSRVSTSNSLYLDGMILILKRYNWYNVGLLSSDYDGVYAITKQLEVLLPRNNISIVSKAVYQLDPTAALKRLLDTGLRIFIVVRAGNVETGIKFECQLKMNDVVGPRYFWIQLGFTRTFNDELEETCSRQMLAEGAEGSLYFTSDLAVSGNETGIGQVPISDMYSSFLSRYPHLVNERVSMSSLATRADGVAAAAIALNKSLMKYNYSAVLDLDSSPLKTELLNNIRAIDFDGLTGRVKMDENGDRLANGIVYQIRGFRGIRVARIDTYATEIEWYQNLVFAGGQPPQDRPVEVTRRLSVSRPNVIIILLLCSAGIALTISSIGINFAFRNLRFIKLSSPNINNLMAVGCILCYLSTVCSAISGHWSESPVYCWLQTVCLCLGYSVAYGAMLAKTWRVHVIFTSKSLRRVSIKDMHLVAVVLAIVAVDIVVFIVWAVYDPITVNIIQYAVVESISAGTIESHEVQECACDNSILWSGIFLGIKGLLLIFGLFFAWETRLVHVESLNDSKKIGVCVYNTLVMGAIGVVMGFVLPSSQLNLRFLLINGCIILCCTTVVIIVFGSKVYSIIKHGPSKVDDINNTLAGNESMFAPTSRQQNQTTAT